MGRGKSKSTDNTPQQLHRVAKTPGRGVRLVSQSKNIVESVRRFFEREKQYGQSINRSNVVLCTTNATGLSKATIKRIHKEYVDCDGQLLTPVKRYIASRIRVNPDSFDRAVIRRVVHVFF